MNVDSDNSRRGSMIGAGIAIGVGFGVALGLSFDNLALGMAIGTALGVAIGVALESRNPVGPGGKLPGSKLPSSQLPGDARSSAEPRPEGRLLLALIAAVGLVFALVVLSVVLMLSLGGA